MKEDPREKREKTEYEAEKRELDVFDNRKY